MYGSEYVERLKTLTSKRKVILDVLKNRAKLTRGAVEVLVRNLERPERVDLARVNPLLLSMLVENLISGRGTLSEKVLAFESYGISKFVVYELLFWMQPSKYPFPSVHVANYGDYLAAMRRELRSKGLDNFLELYALESANKETFLQEVFDKVRAVTPESLEENIWLKEFVHQLTPIDRAELRRAVNPYVWRVLTAHHFAAPVVIDGSNVLMQSELRGPDRIDDLLERISTLPEVYFPFYIVFDENARYKFNSRYLNYKRSYHHSPADELIVSLCIEKRAVVCSKDRFREYEIPTRNIWYEIFGDKLRRRR